jgi:MoaA/NifB/PqqE/SkfB family radical SAM enzyme
VESEASRYSLELRVSLDGTTAEENDRVRGRGSFEGVVATLRRLSRAGLSPTVMVVEHEKGLTGIAARLRFLRLVRDLGIPKARVKFQPLFRIGREIRRTHGYPDEDVLHSVALLPELESSLMCASGRAVTSQGVYTCPILVGHASARLGTRLAEGASAIQLHWDPCQTCVFDGLRCQN